MIKLFKKSESSLFIVPFSADMGLDFFIFLTTWKKSKKSNTYICYAMLFKSYFLSAIWVTHDQICSIKIGHRFTHLLLITTFLSQFYPKVNGSLAIMSLLKLEMDCTLMDRSTQGQHIDTKN